MVHCRCKLVERMNEAISWRDTSLSEVLVTKIDCVHDGHHFCLDINSSLTEIMVERSTIPKTILYSVIPLFASAWLVVNDDRDSKGAQWCGIIIEGSDMQVFPCGFSGIHLGLAHEIESELSLLPNLVPQTFRELCTCAC